MIGDHAHEHPGATAAQPAATAGGSSGDHSHGASRDADTRFLAIALGLIVGFMVVEVVVAILSGSLALLADAGACLVGHFDVEHSTFQLESVGHADHEVGAHS